MFRLSYLLACDNLSKLGAESLCCESRDVACLPCFWYDKMFKRHVHFLPQSWALPLNPQFLQIKLHPRGSHCSRLGCSFSKIFNGKNQTTCTSRQNILYICTNILNPKSVIQDFLQNCIHHTSLHTENPSSQCQTANQLIYSTTH